MGNRRRHLVGGLALVAGVLGLSACNSSKPTASSTSTTISPSSTTSPTTTLPAVPTCSTGVLSLAAAGGGPSAGSSFETFTVTNGGPDPCRLDGYPSLTFFAPTAAGGVGAGPKLAITTEEGGPSAQPVTLKAGGGAEFIAVYSDVPVGGACTTVASVEMAPPGGSESISAPASFSPCGSTVKVYAFGPTGSETP